MERSKKTFIKILFLAVIFSMLLSLTASADTGPKPSVHIGFLHMSEKICYATLLSSRKSYGPYSSWDGESELNGEGYYGDAERAFTGFKDPDGYYFYQNMLWQVSSDAGISWNYYPPENFKILLFFPETSEFLVSGKCERYAFDTYYTVDLNSAVNGQGGIGSIEAYRSYRWGDEILSLVARILITVAIEMAVALLFGFRGKKVMLVLLAVNVATQIMLNVLLNVINFRSGPAAFVTWYVLLEFAVFAVEAIVYSVVLKKIDGRNKPVWFYVLYAFTANAVSFAAGLAAARYIPGIF